jgi:predicted metalloprotease with PDZ domain
MPFFVGRFDLDSALVAGRWYRLGTHPEGALAGSDRERLWEDIQAMAAPMADVFGETPWDDYTILALFEDGYPGGSALEHQNSHLGIYAPGLIQSPVLPLVVAHEIFHAWNVKRLRPEELWPYAYDRSQPTTLLWVSEGITDYYADLALVRGGIIEPEMFYRLATFKITQTEDAGPIALEDASLSTWIEPDDGTAFIYYPKGSLAGLLLDILIRDATDNRSSLDGVMRDLYRSEFKAGSGFTEEEWWDAVSRAAGGRSFDEFRERYIDGRDPYPCLGGMTAATTTQRQPLIDAQIEGDGEGVRVTSVAAGSPAEAAGISPGDYVLRVGEIEVEDTSFAAEFRRRYAEAPEGTLVEIELLRDGRRITTETEIEFRESASYRVEEDPDASDRASRIRDGILTGTVQG